MSILARLRPTEVAKQKRQATKRKRQAEKKHKQRQDDLVRIAAVRLRWKVQHQDELGWPDGQHLSVRGTRKERLVTELGVVTLNTNTYQVFYDQRRRLYIRYLPDGRIKHPNAEPLMPIGLKRENEYALAEFLGLLDAKGEYVRV